MLCINEVQVNMLRTAPKKLSFEDGLTQGALGLVGETGEVVDEIKKYLYHGHTVNKQKIIEEIGDCLWYLSYLAYLLDTSMEEVAIINRVKLERRYPQGFDPDKSVNRED